MAAVVFVVTALAFAPFAIRIVDPVHDGVMLKTALDIADGHVLFRDTYSIWGLLTPWMHVALLELFGRTLTVLKLGTVALYAITATLLVGTWSRLLPLGLALLAWLVWLALPPFYQPHTAMLAWPSVTALTFQALGLYALARAGYASEAPGWAAVAGLGAVFAQWARMPVGLLQLATTATAFVLLAIASRSGSRLRREGAAFAAAAVLSELAFFALLLAQGTVSDWWTQTVVWPAQWADRRAGSMRTAFDCLLPVTRWEVRLGTGTRFDATALGALTGMVVALAAARVIRTRWRRWILFAVVEMTLLALVLARDSALVEAPLGWALLVPLTTLGAVGVGLAAAVRGAAPGPTLAGLAVVLPALSAWAQYVPVADYRHLFWGMAPAVGTCLFALYVFAGSSRAPLAFVVLLLAVPLWHARWVQARAKLQEPMRPVRGVPLLAGMLERDSYADDLERLSGVIQHWEAIHPGTPIMVMGYQALVAALAPDLSNYSPVYLRSPNAPAEPEVRDRFVAARRPLIWVDLASPAELEAIMSRYGYRRLTEPDQIGSVLLAPIVPNPSG